MEEKLFFSSLVSFFSSKTANEHVSWTETYLAEKPRSERLRNSVGVVVSPIVTTIISGNKNGTREDVRACVQHVLPCVHAHSRFLSFCLFLCSMRCSHGRYKKAVNAAKQFYRPSLLFCLLKKIKCKCAAGKERERKELPKVHDCEKFVFVSCNCSANKRRFNERERERILLPREIMRARIKQFLRRCCSLSSFRTTVAITR